MVTAAWNEKDVLRREEHREEHELPYALTAGSCDAWKGGVTKSMWEDFIPFVLCYYNRFALL